METHFANFHQDSHTGSSQIQIRRLPFVLLPPGTWDIAHVVRHYRAFRVPPPPALVTAVSIGLA
jgi:hypothetical protein